MRLSGVVWFSCLFPLIALSQGSSGDSVLLFKVRNPAPEVSVYPPDSILWIGQNNPLTIRVKGNHKIASVTLDGGNISGYDSNYIATVKGGKSALLSVYEQGKGNTLKLIYTKLYTIDKNPDPELNVCGIKKDSVADVKDLIYKNKLVALWEKNKLVCPVLSFSMISSLNGVTDTLHSYNDQFTIDMRNRIHRMQGGVLYFDEVYCLMPDGSKKKLAPIQIFIARTNKYNVGFREF